MNDGAIVFSTELDNKELEKQYQSLVKKIDRLNDKIMQKQAERSPLADQSKQIAGELDAAKARLEYMKSGQEFFTSNQIDAQLATVKETEKSWNSVQTKVERYDVALGNAALELDRNKEKAGAVAQELAAASDGASLMSPALDRASRYMDKFVSRVKGLARRVFIFTVIASALRSIKGWMWKAIKTNGDAVEAIAKMKGALLTLAQPLADVVIPAFITLVKVLTTIITTIGRVFSALSGKQLPDSAKSAKALYGETEALKSVGDAAKDAEKSIASFDELNKIGADQTNFKAGGGAGTSGIAPDFSDLDRVDKKLQGIADLVLAIGTGLLLWKVSSLFTKELANTVQLFMALALAIAGCILAYQGFTDAWKNGVSWENLAKMLSGILLLAGGLYLAFWLINPAAATLAAGIILIVGGLAMLATGFRDVIENGTNLQNTLTTISGIMLAGIGISMLTHSWIPALIAGIASAIYALAYSTGHAKDLMNGVNDFLTGTFTGDWSLAWQGIKEIASATWDSIVDASKLMWAKVTGLLKGAADWMQEHVWTPMDKKLNAFVETVHITWIGFINGLITAVESFVNFFIGGINDIIGAINSMIQAAANALAIVGITVEAPQIPTIPEIAIPRLATGAVIPPNREFLAVLGDQKSGTNIEAPLETIVQAVMLALSKSNYAGGNGQVIENAVYLDGEVIYRNQKKISRRHGVNLVGK